jgi:hypothetical protein
MVQDYNPHHLLDMSEQKMKALSLRPTQFVLGMKEVDHKAAKIKSLGHHDLTKYLKAKTVPVVMGPGGVYLTDHHHLVRACLDAGVDEVFVKVIDDMSNHTEADFWHKMNERNWVYRFDQFGKGPQDVKFLAADVRGLADDNYRSLAWAVGEAGGFRKSEEFFSEFKWSNFFRTRIKIVAGKEGFDTAVALAMKMALGPDTSHLPGHRKPKKDKP